MIYLFSFPTLCWSVASLLTDRLVLSLCPGTQRHQRQNHSDPYIFYAKLQIVKRLTVLTGVGELLGRNPAGDDTTRTDHSKNSQLSSLDFMHSVK